MQKIGLFGGTFDPIHLGHIAIAQQMMKELSLDEIFLLPAGNPYHRHTPAPVASAHRLEMCLLAIEKLANFSVSDIDTQRQSATYTYDTVRLFKHHQPRAQWWWLMGSDSLRQFHQWHRYQDILKEINLAIFWRDQDTLNTLPDATKNWLFPTLQAASNPQANGHIHFLQGQAIDISATEIRKKIAQKQNTEHLLNPQVAQYIQQHQLYQNQ